MRIPCYFCISATNVGYYGRGRRLHRTRVSASEHDEWLVRSSDEERGLLRQPRPGKLFCAKSIIAKSSMEKRETTVC